MRKNFKDKYGFVICMFFSGIVFIISYNGLDLLGIKIVYYCAYCLILSCTHEMGHYIMAKLCNIPICKVGFELYKFFPRAYIKVDLKNSSAKTIIFFYLGGVLGTFILNLCIVLNIVLFKCNIFDLLSISTISIVINMIPIYKSDGYYIVKTLFQNKMAS